MQNTIEKDATFTLRVSTFLSQLSHVPWQVVIQSICLLIGMKIVVLNTLQGGLNCISYKLIFIGNDIFQPAYSL